MYKNEVEDVLVAMIMLFAGCALGVIIIGASAQKELKDIKVEAVKRGYASYEIDKDNEPVFKFK